MAGLREWRSSRALIPLLVVLLGSWGIKTVLRNLDWKDDRTLFQVVLRSHPKNAKCNTLMGDTEFRAGQYPAAERYYRQALEIYPDYAGAAINLASGLDAMKRHGEAIDTLLRFENKSGDLELGRRRELGRAYLGLRDYPRAAAAYKSALTLFEQDAIVHRNLGAIYLHLSKTDLGRFHIRRSLEIAPDQADAAQLRAVVESR